MEYNKAIELAAAALRNYDDCSPSVAEEAIQSLKRREEGLEVIWDDEDMYCSICDNYIYEDENYCKQCGVKLLIHGRDIP